MVKKSILYFIIISSLLILNSCGEIRSVLSGATPYEQYLKSLEDAGLADTEMVDRWRTSGNEALSSPVSVEIPFREKGFIFEDKVIAHGYSFTAARGERIVVKLRQQSEGPFLIFLDLFEASDTTGGANNYSHAKSLRDDDSIVYEVGKQQFFILRMQPELLQSGSYEITIESRPSLIFPVAGKTSSAIQSFWGAAREGGRRSHEGVDIFAPRGTPVVAGESGFVSRTGTNNLGGKVIFISTTGRSLYYAHLDSQLVDAGTRVKAGDTIGLVGNSGNARHTSPHLHFGIYERGEGAIDPLPFIKDIRPAAPVVKIDSTKINKWGKVTAAANLKAAPNSNAGTINNLKAQQPFLILAGADKFYKVQLVNGQQGYLESRLVTNINAPIRNIRLNAGKEILSRPKTAAIPVTTLEKDTTLAAYASLNDYLMVEYDDHYVWVQE